MLYKSSEPMFLWKLLITSKETFLFVASHFPNPGQNRSKVIPRLVFVRVSLNFSVTLQMLCFHKIFEAGISAKGSKMDKLERTSKL